MDLDSIRRATVIGSTWNRVSIFLPSSPRLHNLHVKTEGVEGGGVGFCLTRLDETPFTFIIEVSSSLCCLYIFDYNPFPHTHTYTHDGVHKPGVCFIENPLKNESRAPVVKGFYIFQSIQMDGWMGRGDNRTSQDNRRVLDILYVRLCQSAVIETVRDQGDDPLPFFR